jgi:glycosyltransferase involved in cell wall biosynthesis
MRIMRIEMTILFIAPLPPPTNGQSLASEVLLKRIVEHNTVEVVNQATAKRPVTSWDQIKRSREVFHFLAETLRKKGNADLVYLTISQSIAGNIKDLFFYVICSGKVTNMFIHMHGGPGMKRILDRGGVMYRLNRYFISRMRGVIVLDSAQKVTFSKVIDADKIHIVPNFAEDFLFVSEAEVRKTFSTMAPLRMLFLSNLIYGKGHNELVDAYLALADELKEKVEITFAGGFQSDQHRNEFFHKIKGHKGLVYHGFAAGADKRALYCRSHVFCLPTYYPYEGQPISILEAYATGCAVITTRHSGIPAVFNDQVNGFAVEMRSPDSIKEVITRITENPDSLFHIAIANRNTAYEKYRTSIYTSSLVKILGIDEGGAEKKAGNKLRDGQCTVCS